jgi:9-cis-epoxycarotenoid dioxygenase
MLNGKSPISIDEQKIPHFGVLPKSSKTKARIIMWFDLLESTCFHYANAWEEGDKIVVISDSISPISLIFYEPYKIEFQPSLFCFNFKTRKTYKQQMASANVTIQNINQLYYNNKMRYVYYVISKARPKYGGIAKLDLEVVATTSTNFDCIVGWRKFPIGCYCGEPFFVPQNFVDPSFFEDDGYVITHFHNESKGFLELFVLDARSLMLETIAFVKLPFQVPYGFHCLFVKDE